MIDLSEQQTLSEMNLCDSCKNYPCASVIEIRKDQDINGEGITVRCKGYKKFS